MKVPERDAIQREFYWEMIASLANDIAEVYALPQKIDDRTMRCYLGIGRKNSAQLFHFFICLRIVSALRPAPMRCLAICCEYHTPDILGVAFSSSGTPSASVRTSLACPACEPRVLHCSACSDDPPSWLNPQVRGSWWPQRNIGRRENRLGPPV